MSHLYNCKSDGDQYRISKFTNDLDVEASYLTDGIECDCPAGHRPVCRHRIMLARFIAKDATAGQWFHNYEQNQWIRAASDDESFNITATEIIERQNNLAGLSCDGLEPILDKMLEIASAASQVTVSTTIYTGPVQFERVWEDKPINLLELAKPRYELPEVKFSEPKAGFMKNEIIDEMLPKPLRRL